nr:InlB B-repeat-containing protein [Lachnospiraceae bacterium]
SAPDIQGSLEIYGNYDRGIYTDDSNLGGVKIGGDAGLNIELPANATAAIDLPYAADVTSQISLGEGIAIITPDKGNLSNEKNINRDGTSCTLIQENGNIANSVLITTDCKLSLNGVKVTGANKNNIPAKDGYAVYNSATKTLTVRDKGTDRTVSLGKLSSADSLNIVCEAAGGCMIYDAEISSGSLTLTGEITIDDDGTGDKDALVIKAGALTLDDARLYMQGNLVLVNKTTGKVKLDESSFIRLAVYGTINANIETKGRIEVDTSRAVFEETKGIISNTFEIQEGGSVYVKLNSTKGKRAIEANTFVNKDDIKVIKPENGLIIQAQDNPYTNPYKVVPKGSTQASEVTEAELALDAAVAEKPYLVSFNMQEHGTQVATQQIAATGGTVSRPSPAPTAEGWIFTGWYKEASCINEFDFSTVLYHSTTIYAGWVKSSEPKTVTFEMNGHGNNVKAQTVNKGSRAKEPADPFEMGWIFGGWYTDEGLTDRFHIANETVNDDMTLYAKWTEHPYKLWLGSTPVTEANKDNICNDAERRAVYDPSTKTLSLNEPVINGTWSSSRIMIASGEDITIKGKVTLADDNAGNGINVWPGKTLKTDAEINILTNNHGIVAGHLEVSGGVINAEATSENSWSLGIRINDSLKISGGELKLKGNQAGLWIAHGGEDKAEISGGSLEAEGNTWGAVVSRGKAYKLSDVIIAEPEEGKFAEVEGNTYYRYALCDKDGNTAKKAVIRAEEEAEEETDPEASEEAVKLSAIAVSANLSVKTGETKALTVSFTPENASDKTVSFTSSNEKVATVDDKGNVHGIKPGYSTITVTSKDGGYAASCKLIVSPERVDDTAERTWISPEDLAAYKIPEVKDTKVTTGSVKIGPKGETKEVSVSISMNYIDAVTYTGKAITPDNCDELEYKTDLGNVLNAAGISGKKAEDIFKLSYVGKSRNAGEGSFYAKIALQSKLVKKGVITKQQEKDLKKLVKAVNKALKKNPVKFSINKASMVSLEPVEVHAKLKKDGSLNVKDGKLKGLKSVKARTDAKSDKLKKLSKKLYTLENPDAATLKVKVKGAKNYTGWVTVTAAK